MFPLTPPPVSDTGAWSIPRMLQRWLDVNPIGKLTRTSTFITLPAFSQTVTWQGYSDIVASFNFEGPNNFSLAGFNVEPSPIPNYYLCISWQDGKGDVHRYALWNNVGEVIYETIPLYSGQLIKKNFRFEIWSTNVATVVQAAPINIYTSVLGAVDYRWGTDATLVNSDGENTAFKDTGSVLASVPPTTGLLANWRADYGLTFSSGNNVSAWNNINGSQLISLSTSAPYPTQLAASNLMGLDIIDFNTGLLRNLAISPSLTVGNGFYIGIVGAYSGTPSPANIADFTSAGPVSQYALDIPGTSMNVVNFDGLGTVQVPGTNFCLLQMVVYGTTMIATSATLSNILIGYQSGTVTTNPITGIDLGGLSAFQIAEIFIYSSFASNADYTQLTDYIAHRYTGAQYKFNLPLTFPTTSISQPN